MTLIREHSKIYGWTFQQFTMYKEIRDNLQEALILDANKNWEKIIKDLSNLYYHPPEFWNKLKNLSSTNSLNVH